MQNLEALLGKSYELPSLPEIYIKVSELIENEDSSAHAIGSAVQTDPSLTAKVLKLINSAYYGLPVNVTSVSQAVSLLGRDQLKALLIGSVLTSVFDNLQVDNFSMREFWLHSIKTAIIARHLAMQNASILDHESFFTAGLLHDIGRLVLAKAAPEAQAVIDHLVESEGHDIVDVEADKLGITHVDVAHELMLKWKMPSSLTQCVIKHHQKNHEGPFAIETAIVYLANELSKYPLLQTEEEKAEVLNQIVNWEQAKCPLDQVTIACELAEDQWEEVMDSLGMLDMEIGDDMID